MKKIGQYRLISHGIDGEQYFQGHGLSHSIYQDSATGCGWTELDAFSDALDQLASNGWDVDSLADIRMETTTVAQALDLKTEREIEKCDCHFYFSVDVMEEKL